MIPEIGHFSLIIALFLSLLQFLFPLFNNDLILKNDSKINSDHKFLSLVKSLNIGATFFIILSVLLLMYSFLQDDFTVKYIAFHSNSNLPLRYKLSALWGGHEGSLLLWILILSIWSLIVNIRGKMLSPIFLSHVLSILGAISFAFILFLLITSNPFERMLLDSPLDGIDLNPLLQDPGLIFHPPMLYLGYVGTAIPFAFAIAALWKKKCPDNFASLVRPWVLASFGFLTLGIAWGSYWAYYELGWGGWWFWDPVENASFMPWLLSIALIHSLIVQKKRNQFQGWTLLLMIMTFGLSLLGTFLVRSGSLTSVHAFASDPKRGVYILFMFLIFIGGALLLYGLRAKTLFHENNIEVKSRESLLLLNMILIMILTLSILLGTLFPMLYDLFFDKKISVGFPYFNAVFIPFVIPILFSIPFGPFLKWGNNDLLLLIKKMKWSLLLSVLFSLILITYLNFKFKVSWNTMAFFGLFLAFWVTLGTLERLLFKVQQKGIKELSLGAIGMILAHFGIGVMVFGVVLVSNYQIEHDLRLKPGQTFQLHNNTILFQTIERNEGPNFIGYKASFEVQDKSKIVLKPEKRNYVVQSTTLSETAIDSNIFRDIYLALGDRLEDGSWTIRAYFKPGVRLIWLGALFVAVASLLLATFSRGKKPK